MDWWSVGGERLEIRSLLIASRVALWSTSLQAAWQGVRDLRVVGPTLRSPWVTGVRIEQEASRLLGADSCLPQALAGAAMFRRHGHPVRLVIGVATGHGLRAHAWVELHGTPVVGGAERPGYRAIWEGWAP